MGSVVGVCSLGFFLAVAGDAAYSHMWPWQNPDRMFYIGMALAMAAMIPLVTVAVLPVTFYRAGVGLWHPAICGRAGLIRRILVTAMLALLIAGVLAALIVVAASWGESRWPWEPRLRLGK